MDDTPANELHLGGWIVSASSYADEPDKISISRNDGEGGDFDRADFVALIAQFYKDRF